jgi:DNA-binding NarL/FixJ family response regulator
MQGKDFLVSELTDLHELCDSWMNTGQVPAPMMPVLHQLRERLRGVLETLEPQVSSLTTKEKDVLFYVAQGFTNRQIGEALSVSEKTIEFHLRNIFKKTEASTRAEAVTFALSRGWIRAY